MKGSPSRGSWSRKSIATNRPRRIEMATTKQALLNDTSVTLMLYMALELSGAKWKVAVADGKGPAAQQRRVPGTGAGWVFRLEKPKTRGGSEEKAAVMTSSERGGDGF